MFITYSIKQNKTNNSKIQNNSTGLVIMTHTLKYTFKAKGHPNVTSKHRSTFEVTQDTDMSLAGDCIVGVSSKASLNDIPRQMREAIQNEKTEIHVILETENAHDEIIGYGHPSLTLDHPTDMVCRRSDYTCSRTLMIRADKAAVDLNPDLVDDLKSGKTLKVTLIVQSI
jgi:hypothetical protein